MRKPRMQKRRLLKLAKMLQDDAKNKRGIKFDIGSVGKLSAIAPIDNDAPVEMNCGTTACAMGLAAISGVFKYLSYYTSGNNIWIKWRGRSKDYDRAAKILFGLTSEQVAYLFSPWTYPHTKKIGVAGEREVVRRIKRIVAGKSVVQRRAA